MKESCVEDYLLVGAADSDGGKGSCDFDGDFSEARKRLLLIIYENLKTYTFREVTLNLFETPCNHRMKQHFSYVSFRAFELMKRAYTDASLKP